MQVIRNWKLLTTLFYLKQKRLLELKLFIYSIGVRILYFKIKKKILMIQIKLYECLRKVEESKYGSL